MQIILLFEQVHYLHLENQILPNILFWEATINTNGWLIG